MKPLVIPLENLSKNDLEIAGGKAVSLKRLMSEGVAVAPGLCVTATAYERYAAQPGFRATLALELNRKDFAEMRWEEIWDLALRIRSLFLRTPMPSDLRAELAELLTPWLLERQVVVRSSSLAEDSDKTSFAGLHESFVNISGIDSLLEHIKLVWASLWSDRALLYRQELDLRVEQAKMAVVIQELINGVSSGVVFSQNPLNSNETVIEAVHGLNQGLVDGSVEPDRWLLDKASGSLLSHNAVERKQACSIDQTGGIKFEDLPHQLSSCPPLKPAQLEKIYELAKLLEKLNEAPQDIEWTIKDEKLYCLQARPITKSEASEDKREWYLSLHRSLAELTNLRSQIEDELLPSMTVEADKLAAVDLSSMTDKELAAAIETRRESYEKCRAAYWDICIPFAHGMRLFGKIYNDTVSPKDPHEFMSLLTGTSMLTTARNERLGKIAQMVRDKAPADDIEQQLNSFCSDFAHSGDYEMGKDTSFFRALVHKMASQHTRTLATESEEQKNSLEENFIQQFKGTTEEAKGLLEIARASYRLRDEDNLYLGRVQFEIFRAADEGKNRLPSKWKKETRLKPVQISTLLNDPQAQVELPEEKEAKKETSSLRPRQLLGQPAGPGVAEGRACVINSSEDFAKLEDDDILVCDAISPTMSFVVPLVSAIVERRGGMLIHGAIIAREYGIPCVTGVPEATEVINDGDRLVVDGYLGIVRVQRENI